jgi:hypothetical protein
VLRRGFAGNERLFVVQLRLASQEIDTSSDLVHKVAGKDGFRVWSYIFDLHNLPTSQPPCARKAI